MRRLTLVAAVVSLLAPPASAQTIASWDGSGFPSFGAVFDANGRTSAGQTFHAPGSGSPILQSWTFWLEGNSSPDPFGFRVGVATWVNNAIGTVLWDSGPTDVQITSPIRTATTFAPNVTLVGGTSYVFFLQARAGAGSIAGIVGSTSPIVTDPYTEGVALIANDVAGSLATIHPYQTSAGDAKIDWAFQATFSPATTTTPEPSTVVLMATALVAVGGVASFGRRRAD